MAKAAITLRLVDLIGQTLQTGTATTVRGLQNLGRKLNRIAGEPYRFTYTTNTGEVLGYNDAESYLYAAEKLRYPVEEETPSTKTANERLRSAIFGDEEESTVQDQPERTLRTQYLKRGGIVLVSVAVSSHGWVMIRHASETEWRHIGQTELTEAFAIGNDLFNIEIEGNPEADVVLTVREDEEGKTHSTEYTISGGERVEKGPGYAVRYPPTQPSQAVEESQESATNIEQKIDNNIRSTPAPIKAEALGLAMDLDLRVGDAVTLRVPAWMLRPAPDGKDLASRILEGKITALTQSGLQFEGNATVRDCEWCHRCGRAITHPASLRVGYGPVCSDRLGIDWTTQGLTEEDLTELKARIQRDTYVKEMWLPRRSVSVLERTPAPVTQEQEARSLDAALTDLIRRKNGQSSKTHAWIVRQYGGEWETLDAQVKQLALDVLEEFPPASAPQAHAEPNLSEKAPQVRQAAPQATATAYVSGMTIFVQSPYSPENAQISRSVRGGRWNPTVKAWTYPADPRTAATIKDAWREKGITTDVGFNELVDQFAIREEEAERKLEDVI